jgi:hypothetical protein
MWFRWGTMVWGAQRAALWPQPSGRSVRLDDWLSEIDFDTPCLRSVPVNLHCDGPAGLHNGLLIGAERWSNDSHVGFAAGDMHFQFDYAYARRLFRDPASPSHRGTGLFKR